ncbi:MAG: hypothetical protein JO210_02800 [Acidobacteriaceae bacterium]|nr:hypothetical protein [Acidobacteriaceae bacterium]
MPTKYPNFQLISVDSGTVLTIPDLSVKLLTGLALDVPSIDNAGNARIRRNPGCSSDLSRDVRAHHSGQVKAVLQERRGIAGDGRALLRVAGLTKLT